MKRFFLVTLLVIGICLPQQIEVGNGRQQWSVTFSTQARHKKAKKAKSAKQKKQQKKGENAQNRQTAIMPLIGSTPATGTATKDRSLLKVKMAGATSCQAINYKAITVYFNSRLRIPMCVAYELTNTMVAMSDAPTAERRKNYQFATDQNVPGCPSHHDYSGSGYTRGHMAPAMDMRWDPQVMRECFYMTNMCPQVAKLNNDNWRLLEEKVHRWAKRDGRLIVFTGPIMGSKHEAIGPKHNIAVPEAFYKIIYAPQQQRAIAFIYSNSERNGGMERQATTINEVERRTGMDFFTSLPSATEQSIEAQCDLNSWK